MTSDTAQVGSDADGDGYISLLDGGDDCDDADDAVHPDATEACNLVDDNCDGEADEGCAMTLDHSPTGGGISWTCASGPGSLWLWLPALLILWRRC